jgi:hypothetical protein
MTPRPLGGTADSASLFAHLGDAGAYRCAWILTGREVDRGLDQEPLVADSRPLAILSQNLLDRSQAPLPTNDSSGPRLARMSTAFCSGDLD